MESDNWVSNKQTVDVNFYILSRDKLTYKNPFCKQNRRVAFRVYNSVVKKNKLNPFIYKLLRPFFVFYYLVFFYQFMNPFSHVTFSFEGIHHEVREGKHFWRHKELVGDRFILKEKITLNCGTIPSSEKVLGYTRNLRLHRGAHCPKALAFGIVYAFFPIRILGYPRNLNDCVTVTTDLLRMFGIETSKYAWTPKLLYDDLIKKEYV